VLKASHAVLDVSGGDSFTDLYGMRRFEAMTLSKRMVLAAGRPLILLPQTLGPFNDSVCRRKAAHILRCASAVWTRDHGSLQLLRDLLGADFDPARHRQGVDLALALPAVAPKTALPECIASWIEQPPEARSRPVFGVNVSGLLYNSIDGGRAQFDLADNYSEAIEAIARALLTSHPSARLLLIPHVLVEDRNPESDWIACRSLQQVLGDTAPGRVEVLPPFYGAAELKSLFTRLDWFCGTRMHATIGAFSEGVPTLALAYSDKTEGVFKACGLAGLVSDLRRSRANALGEVALASFAARAQTSDTLRRILPIVKATAEFQMDDIADSIRALSSSKAAA
jgi:polysaccharide pyruvyl transferase WcaK-like protein